MKAYPSSDGIYLCDMESCRMWNYVVYISKVRIYNQEEK